MRNALRIALGILGGVALGLLLLVGPDLLLVLDERGSALIKGVMALLLLLGGIALLRRRSHGWAGALSCSAAVTLGLLTLVTTFIRFRELTGY